MSREDQPERTCRDVKPEFVVPTRRGSPTWAICPKCRRLVTCSSRGIQPHAPYLSKQTWYRERRMRRIWQVFLKPSGIGLEPEAVRNF